MSDRRDPARDRVDVRGPDGQLRGAYAHAGVDVAAGDRAVELMRARVGAAAGVDVLAGIGGFASAVRLPGGMREPVLVSATDGVGTKTAIARSLRRVDTIGIDLVAMCADDVVCLGARPLFFLDYVAVGRVEPVDVADLVGGIARGCELAGCALVGGETAEHPGLMDPDEFDLAGFCVGIAERAELFDAAAVREGDVLLGLASSGLHSNGFSLVRALVERHRIPLARPYLELVRGALGDQAVDDVSRREPAHAFATLGEVLLTPTRIYAPDVLALRAHLAGLGLAVHGVAHVTGGGLPGNVPRVLPESLAARVRLDTWELPSVVRVIAELGHLAGPELRGTLNAGIGMVLVLPEDAVDPARAFLDGRGVSSWRIGDVVPASMTDDGRYLEVEGAPR